MKRYMSLLAVLLVSITFLQTPVHGDSSIYGTVTTSTIYLNGDIIACNGFNIADNNYFRLRDISSSFAGTSSQFDVMWNDSSREIEIETGKAYTQAEGQAVPAYNDEMRYMAVPTTSKVLVNGTYEDVAAYNIDGYNYFKLRDLGEIADFHVGWDGSLNRIFLETDGTGNIIPAEVSGEVVDNVLPPFECRWQNTLDTYLMDNGDGRVSVVEAVGHINIETYDSDLHQISQQTIGYELPLFGGFYSGEKYNYIAYGQNNLEEKDGKEVIRVVRYDKSFKRLGSVSVYGGESLTVTPFIAGSGSMDEENGVLVFHTSRLRYRTGDGLNHESQLTLYVDTETMTIKNYLGEFQGNHVSHSLDQFTAFDGSTAVFVDHGDAYPRSIVLHKQIGTEPADETGKYGYKEADLLNISGAIGANYTGTALGGLGISSSSYLIAMNTVDQSAPGIYTNQEKTGMAIDQRDVILAVVSRFFNDGAKTSLTYLGRYVGTDRLASIPRIVPVGYDRFLVLWQEFDITGKINRGVRIAMVDGQGRQMGITKTLDGYRLSRCRPIVTGNSMIWYVNETSEEGSRRIFYRIPLEALFVDKLGLIQ